MQQNHHLSPPVANPNLFESKRNSGAIARSANSSIEIEDLSPEGLQRLKFKQKIDRLAISNKVGSVKERMCSRLKQ